ncbi:MAG: septation protein A [Pseudomonadota bacterium]|nr:septation protein A [Pseudomonadota bacterium]
MKLLFDFLPVVLFFGTFKYAEGHADWAARFSSENMAFLVSGGVVGPDEAPILLATLVVIVATLLQVAIQLLRGKKVDMMLWVTFGLVVVLGGATIWFHNATFIKWKPSVLYWVMALSLWISQVVFEKNLLQKLIGEQLELPATVWQRINFSWVAFFGLMGLVNLYVAYTYSTSTWATFKAFGSTGMMLVFMVAQGFYMNRHLKPLPAPNEPTRLDRAPESVTEK